MSNSTKTLEALKNFDLESLDLCEQHFYKHHIQSMTKEEALQVIINTVEGDFSQLSTRLAEIAEAQEAHVKNTAANPLPDYSNKFPNGLSNWIETHHEVVSHLVLTEGFPESKAAKTMQDQGTGGVYELAEALTDKFENENKGVLWGSEEGLEYFEAIEKFLNENC